MAFASRSTVLGRFFFSSFPGVPGWPISGICIPPECLAQTGPFCGEACNETETDPKKAAVWHRCLAVPNGNRDILMAFYDPALQGGYTDKYNPGNSANVTFFGMVMV